MGESQIPRRGSDARRAAHLGHGAEGFSEGSGWVAIACKRRSKCDLDVSFIFRRTFGAMFLYTHTLWLNQELLHHKLAQDHDVY